MVDDYAALARHFDNNSAFKPAGGNPLSQLRSFQPKFDVSETAEGYTLHGELPGIDSKDVQIEWSDGNTLTISGRTEHRYEIGPESNATRINEPTSAGALEAGTAETGSSYAKPSVEDEAGQSTTTAEASEQATSSEVAKTNTTQDVAKQSAAPKYWVSERSVGQFHRSFSFPTRVDQDNVKASLKNGILEVIIPKSAKPQNKKIEIQ
jgi:HSP20 family molecular chaperone IbpA